MKNLAKILVLVLTVAALVGALVFAVSAETATTTESGFNVVVEYYDENTQALAQETIKVEGNKLLSIWTSGNFADYIKSAGDGATVRHFTAANDSTNIVNTVGATYTKRIVSVTLLGEGETYYSPYITITHKAEFTLNLNGNTLIPLERFEISNQSSRNGDGTALYINGGLTAEDTTKRGTILTNSDTSVANGGNKSVQLIQGRPGTTYVCTNVDFELTNGCSNLSYDSKVKLAAFKNCNIVTSANVTLSPTNAYIPSAQYVFENTTYKNPGNSWVFSVQTGNACNNKTTYVEVTGPANHDFDIYLLGNTKIDTTSTAYKFTQNVSPSINKNYGLYWCEGVQNVYVAAGVQFPTAKFNVRNDAVADTSDDAPKYDANNLPAGVTYDPSYILWTGKVKEVQAYTENGHSNVYSSYNNNVTYTTHYVKSISYDYDTLTATVGDTFTPVFFANGNETYGYTLTSADNIATVVIDGVSQQYLPGSVISATPVYTDDVVVRRGEKAEAYYVGIAYTDSEGNALESDITVEGGKTYELTSKEVYKKAEDIAYTVELGEEVIASYTDNEITYTILQSWTSAAAEYTITAYTDIYFYGADPDKYNACRLKINNNFSGTFDLNANTLYWCSKDGSRAATVEVGNQSSASVSVEKDITFKNGTIHTKGMSGTCQVRPYKNLYFKDIKFDIRTGGWYINEGGANILEFNGCEISYTKQTKTLITHNSGVDFAVPDAKAKYGDDGVVFNFINTAVTVENWSTIGSNFISIKDNGKSVELTINIDGDCKFNNRMAIIGDGNETGKKNTATINFHEGVTVGTEKGALYANMLNFSTSAWDTTINYVKKDATVAKELFFKPVETNKSVLTTEYDYVVTTEGNAIAYDGTDFDAIITTVTSGSVLDIYTDMVMDTAVKNWANGKIRNVTINLHKNTLTMSAQWAIGAYVATDSTAYIGMYVTVNDGKIVMTGGGSKFFTRHGMDLTFNNVDFDIQGNSNIVDDRGCTSITFNRGSIHVANTGVTLISTQDNSQEGLYEADARVYTFNGVKFTGRACVVANVLGTYQTSVKETVFDDAGNPTSTVDWATPVNPAEEHMIVNFTNCDFSETTITKGLVKIGVRNADLTTDKKAPTYIYWYKGSVVVNFDMNNKVGKIEGLPEKDETVNTYNGVNDKPADVDYTFNFNFVDGDKVVKYAYVDNGILKPLALKSNLTLFTDFNLNFFIPAVIGDVVVTANGETVETVLVEVDGVNYIKFTIKNIAANAAAENVEFTITYYGNVTATGTYSIVNYATQLLASDKSTESKNLVASAVRYINDAYAYAGAASEALAALVASDNYANALPAQVVVDDITADIGNANVAISGATYSLGSEFKIVLKLKDTFTGTLIVNGKEYAVVNGVANGETSIAITMRAYELYNEDIVITGEGIEGTYDLAKYIYNVKGAEDNLDTLLNSLYTYCFYAAEYKAYSDVNGLK